jgi:hypothetical protein
MATGSDGLLDAFDEAQQEMAGGTIYIYLIYSATCCWPGSMQCSPHVYLPGLECTESRILEVANHWRVQR